ncbi:MAG: hypothetical protein M3N21_05805 [Actinomycetota bacterium]|nr:hypothetical protein [Actinomycetota bacterium]
MPWLIVDIALALLALVVLGAVLLGLWRQVKALGAEVSRAGAALGEATDRLAAVQDTRGRV